MESWSFPSSFDIAGRYAKHRVLDFCTLRGTGDNQVIVRNFHDIYYFDIKPWTSETAKRNLLTIAGSAINGSGTPYIIWIYGKTTIKP